MDEKAVAIFLGLLYGVLLQGGETHERDPEITVRPILHPSALGVIRAASRDLPPPAD